ncbi:Imm26 family immunity protein [Bacteroides pyogenes]|uniref:Imm26 family immunity protein n=1 Tax=Bacteroides pyogenes TaxID=310300 RepID=UPI002FD8CD03
MQEERLLKQNTRILNVIRIMEKVIVYPGEIFCIPLFMPKDDWKLKMKLSDEDLDKEFAFGRVIETSSSVLVEIFKKRGSAKTSINEIVNSGILFSPLQIFWDGVIKKTVANNRQNRKLR